MIKVINALLALGLMVASPVFAVPEVSSPSNHVVSGGQGVEKSVDSSDRTKWCGLHEGRPVQWMLKLSEDGGMAVKSYSIISGNDVPTRDPKDWVLEGSQDGEYWTELDRQTDQPVFEKRFQSKTFQFENDSAWQFYRFTFGKTHDETHFQFSEIALDGVSMDGVKLAETPTLDEVKVAGALRSIYRKPHSLQGATVVPKANLETFRNEIEPVLRESCIPCHGPEKQKGKFRIDTLNPDLIDGGDQNWWLEVIDVVSNGEMPPQDEDVQISGEGKASIVDWLSTEIQVASQVARSEEGHSSFRRMTRYEFNYALQDLLGLPYDLADGLPPETTSEDGFQNSSEMLQMSVMQFETFRELGRNALKKATVSGEQPKAAYSGITMDVAAERIRAVRDAELEGARKRNENDPAKREKELEHFRERYKPRPTTHPSLMNLETGEGIISMSDPRATILAWDSVESRPEVPPVSPHVLIVPPRTTTGFNLKYRLPDTGTLRVRIRACRSSDETEDPPNLRLYFGHQASNNSFAFDQIGETDVAITAPPGNPQFYEWDIHLGEVIRNSFRKEEGARANRSEYLKFENIRPNPGRDEAGIIHIDYVELISPYFDQWPPESHTKIFFEHEKPAGDESYTSEVLSRFMTRAWRRPVTEEEIERKLTLYSKIRPDCESFEEAMIEVLATVIASPKFLYLVQSRSKKDSEGSRLSDYELATRLSMFLWSSLPDQELMDLAISGELKEADVLSGQTERMLADPRADRFSKHFVRQWLGMQLLDYLQVDRKVFGGFNDELKHAMQQEPVAFYHEVLRNNHSIMDFIHSDYTMINERLAQHYGIPNIFGSHFRKIALDVTNRRGGLLTQAGLLAMNSDGKDSHPLKRGIWLLENLLHDPPPPPPPAVPEIDLTDPEILKLSLKERMEDHRNDPACMSCHARIDPWGIAFENFDMVGRWRTHVAGKPVDANSVLFNNQELKGMDGLKRFLLKRRQDQFVRAMVHKLTSYALGRPLRFSDRADLEKITAELRQQDDGLATLVRLIVISDLFQTK